MSEDTFKFFFKMDSSSTSIDETASQLVAVFERDGDRVSELAYQKKRKDGFISFWAPEPTDDATIREGLRLLRSGSGDRTPYAEVEMDQTNDTFFYALAGDHLVSFASRQEVDEHHDAAGKISIEETLVEQASPGATVLLVRIRFDRPSSRNTLLGLARSLITHRSTETYRAFKQAIDASASSPGDVDFPFTRLWRDSFAKENMSPEASDETFELMKGMREDESEDAFHDRIAPRLAWLKKQRFDTEPLSRSRLGNLDLGHALRDCAADRKYLFLLFVHPSAFGVQPCKEEDLSWQARNNIRNGEGLQVLELLECLLLSGDVDRLSAKLYSPLEGASATFYGVAEGMECTPWFDRAPLPPVVWP